MLATLPQLLSQPGHLTRMVVIGRTRFGQLALQIANLLTPLIDDARKLGDPDVKSGRGLERRSECELCVSDLFAATTQLFSEVLDIGLAVAQHFVQLFEIALGGGDEFVAPAQLLGQTGGLSIVAFERVTECRHFALEFLAALVALAELADQALGLLFVPQACVAKLRQFVLGRGQLVGVVRMLANSLMERAQLAFVLSDALVALPQLLAEVIDV
jgi:hypothetical protein